MVECYDALVGYTGFVGSNIMVNHKFAGIYNSKNINDAFDKKYDTLVYSGVRAEKFLANTNPETDRKLIDNAIENIKKINAKHLVLISTVDVYKYPEKVYEDTAIITENLHPYGMNGYILEKWVQDNVPDHFILRLPALFGINLKKNFIFDMVKVIPSMLNTEKYHELKDKIHNIGNYYYQDGTFYKLKSLNPEEMGKLKDFFKNNDFNALSFTDYRSLYQFYNLRNLWKDINIAIQNNIRLLNISSEPISAGELYQYIYGQPFSNTLQKPVNYDMRSEYSDIFGGNSGYLYMKDEILKNIKEFVVRGL